MKQNKYSRYYKSAGLFLAGYLSYKIFGWAVWQFVVVNVQRWLSHGAIGDTIGGLVGAAVFVAVIEIKRTRKAAAAENQRRQMQQFMERVRSEAK